MTNQPPGRGRTTSTSRTVWDGPNCEMCGEPCGEPFKGVVTMVGHRECFLRDGMGGIGHLLAHEYWCSQRGDPDAGLTYRQSALLVDAWVQAVGYPEV